MCVPDADPCPTIPTADDCGDGEHFCGAKQGSDGSIGPVCVIDTGDDEANEVLCKNVSEGFAGDITEQDGTFTQRQYVSFSDFGRRQEYKEPFRIDPEVQEGELRELDGFTDRQSEFFRQTRDRAQVRNYYRS
jgi:hypothetical protein